jgi:hypothetical protein
MTAGGHAGACAAVLACATPALGQPITAESIGDQHVQKAIEAIIEELYRRHDPQRFWEPETIPRGESPQQGGYTALAVLALASAGESYQDPRVREAVAHLERLPMDRFYAVAVRTILWASLPPRYQRALAGDARLLLRSFGRQSRSWDYSLSSPRPTYADNSIRQFGALALWEAAKRGIDVPEDVWRQIEGAFVDVQLADGGWNYREAGGVRGSMTAAGLATLFITQDLLHARRSVPLTDRAQSPQERAIANGLRWMDQNFSATENPGFDDYFFYYLYSVERVALAGGFKRFAGEDWYRAGAAEIIRRLCRWDAETGEMIVHTRMFGDGRRRAIRNNELAFGLMFLSRGRVPIAINKLRDESIRWNNRPRDVANLVQWVREEAAADLNWQIVDLSEEPEEWLDAPMLWLASNTPPTWARSADSAEARKLRRYLDLGGMIFAVNEGTTRGFAEAIEQLGQAMYPHLQWRDLPPGHWAYNVHRPVRANRPRLRGLSNGVRELIILAPGDDITAVLQAREEANAAIYHTAANVYFYASEKNRARPRLAALAKLKPEQDVPPTPAMHARIVRARHSGIWTPEPAALERFAAWLDAVGEMRITIDDQPLDAVHELNPSPQLVIVSGIDEHAFTDAERGAVRAYVQQGGVILFETIGGVGGFARSAETMAGTIFHRPAQSLLRHRVITGEHLPGAVSLSRVEYRPYTMHLLGSLDTVPRLRGMEVGGEVRLLFSRDDLSHALLDQPCWGISGYSPATARRMLRNVILHAAAQQESRDDR